MYRLQTLLIITALMSLKSSLAIYKSSSLEVCGKSCRFNDGLYIEDNSNNGTLCNEDYYLYPGESLRLVCKSCDSSGGTQKGEWHLDQFGSTKDFGSRKLPNILTIEDFSPQKAGLYRCSDASGVLQSSREVSYCSKTIPPPIVSCKFRIPTLLTCHWIPKGGGDLCTRYSGANLSVSGSGGEQKLILQDPNCTNSCEILPIQFGSDQQNLSQTTNFMLNLDSKISLKILAQNRRGLQKNFDNYWTSLSNIFQPDPPHVDVVYADDQYVEIRIPISQNILSYIRKFSIKIKLIDENKESFPDLYLDEFDEYRKYLRSIFLLKREYFPDYKLALKPESGQLWSDFSEFQVPDQLDFGLSCDAQLIWQEQGMKYAYFFPESSENGSLRRIQVVLEQFSDMPKCDRVFKYQVKVLGAPGAEVISYNPSRAFFNISTLPEAKWPLKMDVKLMGGMKQLFHHEISLEKWQMTQQLNPTVLVRSGVNYRPTLLWKHHNKTGNAKHEHMVRLIYSRCATRARFCSSQNSIIDVKDDNDVGSYLLPKSVFKVRMGLCHGEKCSPSFTPQHNYRTFEDGLNITSVGVQIDATSRVFSLQWDINPVFNTFIGSYEICIVKAMNMKLCRTIKNPSHHDGFDDHPTIAAYKFANEVLFGIGKKTAKFACSDIDNQTKVAISMSIFGLDSTVLLTRRTMTASTHCGRIPLVAIERHKLIREEASSTTVSMWLLITLSVFTTSLVMVSIFSLTVFLKNRHKRSNPLTCDKIRQYSGNTVSNFSSMVDDSTTTSRGSGTSSEYRHYLTSDSDKSITPRSFYFPHDFNSAAPIPLTRPSLRRDSFSPPKLPAAFTHNRLSYSPEQIRAEHTDYGSEPRRFRFPGLVRPYGSYSNLSQATRFDEAGYAVPESCYNGHYPSCSSTPRAFKSSPVQTFPINLPKSPSENCLLAQLLRTVPDVDPAYRDCSTSPNTPHDDPTIFDHFGLTDYGSNTNSNLDDSMDEAIEIIDRSQSSSGYSARRDVARAIL